MYSERQLIDQIRRLCGGRGDERVIRGIGDDCAVVRLTEGLLQLVSTDALVENIHFNLTWHPAVKLGRKAASVNISDIAAMAGIPRFAFLTLGLTADTDSAWLDGFLQGFKDVLDEHGVLLLGGDTVKSVEALLFSVTVLGEVAENEICFRSGARPGDLILASGTLGDAAAGLAVCRNRLADPHNRYAPLVARHLDPLAKVELGRFLGASHKVHAMLDSSDGLATDIAHLCKESGVGAEIFADRLPMSKALRELAEGQGLDPLYLALSGGEDYQLLLTVAEGDAAALVEGCRAQLGEKLTVVGRIVGGRGVMLEQDGGLQDISFQGYDHFRPQP